MGTSARAEISAIAAVAVGRSLVQRTIMDWINHAEEAGLSEDDQEMLTAVHDQDWNYIHDHVEQQQ